MITSDHQRARDEGRVSMAQRPVKKAAPAKTATKAASTTRKTSSSTTRKTSAASATRKTSASRKAPASAPAKRHGDVLGIATGHVPKGGSKAVKSSKGTRKRKSIGVLKRRTGIEHLNPARVRN
jgi:hypothetical protein